MAFPWVCSHRHFWKWGTRHAFTSETPGSTYEAMLSIFTITIAMLLGTARAGPADGAAAVLSRYPRGAVPLNEITLEAIAELGASGSEDDVSLLADLAAHEVGGVRSAVAFALDELTSRLRYASRSLYSEPSHRQIHAWLDGKMLVDDTGRTLGVEEQRAVAYTRIALGHGICEHTPNWKAIAHQLEADGESFHALQQYAAAVLVGEFDALVELEAFGLRGERMVLGLFTSLPAERQQSSPLLAWLQLHGGTETVALFSERSTGGSALQRAFSLDSLSQLIRSGNLNRATTAKARHSLVTSTRDPHAAVRTLARAALVEIDG